MKLVLRIMSILAIMLVIVLLTGLIVFKINTGAVSKESEEVEIMVEENTTYYALGKTLKENGLIKSDFWYKVYIKITNPSNLQYGLYTLNKNMTLKQIVDVFEEGKGIDPNLVTVTFPEGINMRKVAKIIEENTENSYDDVLNQVEDKEYIQELIDEYWFLTDEVLDSKIYYPLEGYLFPDTYNFSKKSSVKDILEVMLKQTDKVLTEYKDDIEDSNYSVHQILTLASIVELEASKADDRKGVAGVFYNRLNSKGWTLGSDVTAYYALKIDDFSVSLTDKMGLKDCSTGYNTRCPSMGGLPVGPIANPGEESIDAVIHPSSHNYYYFVADCSGKTYLNTTASGHALTISQLKSQGNWCA